MCNKPKFNHALQGHCSAIGTPAIKHAINYIPFGRVIRLSNIL